VEVIMGDILISYRREDSADICERFYDHLVARYGKPAVFKDVNNIPYGEGFPVYIQTKLRECAICLAVIGPRWLDAATPDGRRRLDDPNDFVRIEMETALRLGLVVVPILVYGAAMPPAEALPDTLARLPQLNTAQVRLSPTSPRTSSASTRASTAMCRHRPPLPLAVRSSHARRAIASSPAWSLSPC
jgi:hypothetical protein